MSEYQSLADYLEIDVEYLDEIQPEIEENMGSSGEMLYNYFFYVPEDVDPDILNELGWRVGELIDDIPLNIYQEQDDYEMWIDQFSGAHEIFYASLIDNKNLLSVQVERYVEEKYFQLLYVNLITTLETYLNDVFIHRVMCNDKYIRNMFERTGIFAHEDMKVKDLYKKFDEKESIALNYLQKLSWHDIKRVEKLFKGVLGIKLNGDLEFIKVAIRKRHDFVHRNGTTTKAEKVDVDKIDVETLIEKIKTLVYYIEDEIKNLDEE